MQYFDDLLSHIKQQQHAPSSFNIGKYLGSASLQYHVSFPIKRTIAKTFVQKNKDMPQKDFLTLLHMLFRGVSFEEKTMASLLLFYLPEKRKHISPKDVDAFLDHLSGWAEIDTLCYGVFSAEELLVNWDVWCRFLRAWASDVNITKRRASLVLLTKPISKSTDPRLSDVAFTNIETLQQEKDILITKAISWLLRSGVLYNRKRVEEFLVAHKNSLPKIAIRETTTKLITGIKNKKKRSI